MNDEIKKLKNKLVSVLVVALLIVFSITGCQEKYDSAEKHIVNITVLRTEKSSYWTGKFYAYDYNVYFDVGGGQEWIVDNWELFNLVEEGDEISVFRTDYVKDGKVVDSGFEFIN